MIKSTATGATNGIQKNYSIKKNSPIIPLKENSTANKENPFKKINFNSNQAGGGLKLKRTINVNTNIKPVEEKNFRSNNIQIKTNKQLIGRENQSLIKKEPVRLKNDSDANVETKKNTSKNFFSATGSKTIGEIKKTVDNKIQGPSKNDIEKIKRIKELLARKKVLEGCIQQNPNELYEKNKKLDAMNEEIEYRNDNIESNLEKYDAEQRRGTKLETDLRTIATKDYELRHKETELDDKIKRTREEISNMNLMERANTLRQTSNPNRIQFLLRPRMAEGNNEAPPEGNRTIPVSFLMGGRLESLLSNLQGAMMHLYDHTAEGPKGLTPEQFERIPVTKWKEELKVINNSYEMCPICYVDYEEGHVLKKLDCNHGYHKDCLKIWLEKNKSCPTCKQEVKA